MRTFLEAGTVERSEPDDEERAMRVVVNEFMSLDGVVQAPGGPEEDTDGGFATAAGRCRTSTPR